MRMSSNGAGNACIAFELLREKLAQRPVALRPAGEAVARKRAALALEHRVRRGDEPVERNLVGVVVAAGEIVFGHARPFGRGRRRARRQQGREIELSGRQRGGLSLG